MHSAILPLNRFTAMPVSTMAVSYTHLDVYKRQGLYTTQLVNNANRKYLNDPAWKLLLDANPFIAGQTDSLLYKDLDVKTREDMILQQSNSIEHSLGFSGANDQGGFALSIGTVHDEGMVIGSSLKRWNMNFNGSLNVGTRMKVSTNIGAYSVTQALPYNDPNGGGTGGLMQRFIGVAPTVRYRNDTSGVLLPGPNDATPVSYTHLDVYKRQIRIIPVAGLCIGMQSCINIQDVYDALAVVFCGSSFPFIPYVIGSAP